MAANTSYTVGANIPDASLSGLASTRIVNTPMGVLTDVNVTLNISNGWNGDLYAYLVHNSGFSVLLNRVGTTGLTPQGYGDPGINVTIDDQATNDIHLYRATLGNPFAPLGGPLTGTWAPDARSANPAVVTDASPRTDFLGSFNGLNPNGEWTLFIADVEGGDESTLISWGLQLCGLPPVAPVIATQPASQTIECSSNAVFTVTTLGTAPLTNQWYFGGAPIPGATGLALTITSASLAQSGQYTFVLCNMAGCVTSTPAMLTVQDTRAPMLTCSTNRIVECATPAGTVVSFPTPATDDCDTHLMVVCTPASGSVFQPGLTTVNCHVADLSGNSNSCSFTITVQPSADLSVTVVASPSPVVVGNELLYTVTVSNQSPCLATGITLSNLLSPGQMLVRVTNGLGSPGMACPVPTPLAWWRAEGDGSDAAGANHGTLNGGISFVPGEVGQSFHFDGVNDYVSVPDAPALRPASFTIEGWVKVQDPNGVHVIVSKPQGASSADSYSVWLASGVLYAAVSDNAGSGQFVTYPELPTSSIFKFTDIVDLESLANKLKSPAPGDGVSQYISTQLSPPTVSLLAAYVSGPDAPLQRRLVGDFNNIIESGAIYTPARFAGVTLSAESQYVLGRNPVGPDLVRLNRLLIRDAYPTEIAMNLFPQLNQRYHVAYSFDDVTKVQALYINGGLVDMTVVNKTITYDGHALLIGADDDNGTPASFFQGDIDELTLYGRALSGTEIESIHRADGGGKCLTPAAYDIGNLAGGASHTVTLVVVTTNCVTVSATATVAATSTDANAANNSASASSTVEDINNSQLVLTIVKVSPNSELLEICWPTLCGPYELQATGDLTLPITWTTVSVPVQVIGNKNCTIVQPSASMRYFQLRRP